MAAPIISCFDPYAYSIGYENLEKIYSLINENNAILTLLIDWICECDTSLENAEDRDRIMPALFFTSRAIKKIQRLLPPL